jgi:hypothetical protein
MATKFGRSQPDDGRIAGLVMPADSVDLAVLSATDIIDHRELAVGRDLDVERVEASGHVVILTVYLSIAVKMDAFLNRVLG